MIAFSFCEWVNGSIDFPSLLRLLCPLNVALTHSPMAFSFPGMYSNVASFPVAITRRSAGKLLQPFASFSFLRNKHMPRPYIPTGENEQ